MAVHDGATRKPTQRCSCAPAKALPAPANRLQASERVVQCGRVKAIGCCKQCVMARRRGRQDCAAGRMTSWRTIPSRPSGSPCDQEQTPWIGPGGVYYWSGTVVCGGRLQPAWQQSTSPIHSAHIGYPARVATCPHTCGLLPTLMEAPRCRNGAGGLLCVAANAPAVGSLVVDALKAAATVSAPQACGARGLLCKSAPACQVTTSDTGAHWCGQLWGACSGVRGLLGGPPAAWRGLGPQQRAMHFSTPPFPLLRPRRYWGPCIACGLGRQPASTRQECAW